MRVATLSNPKLMVDLISRSQADLARLQSQAATGKAFVAPSEDPFGATRSLQLTRALDQLEQYERNAGRAEDRLTLQEVTLGDLGSLFQRVRELTIQGNSGLLSDVDRRAIAAEVSQLREEVISLANAADGEGRFLFAGTAGSVRPFSETTGAVQYLGDQTERVLQIGPSRTVSDGVTGDAVFMRVTNGNGDFVTSADAANTGTAVIDAGNLADLGQVVDQSYRITFTSPTDYEVRDGGGTLVSTGTYDSEVGNSIVFAGLQVGITGEPAPGDAFDIAPSTNQDVFATMQQLIDALNRPAPTPEDRAAFNNAINGALANIDQLQENLSVQRSRIGARLNAVESQRSLNNDSAILLDASKSAVEDVDLVEAISSLERELNSLEAAQQSFIAVQRLSLFNFL